MLKRIVIGLILIFLSTSVASAQSASVTAGAAWLTVNQNADKSWGGGSSSVTPFNTTAAAVYALKICGNMR